MCAPDPPSAPDYAAAAAQQYQSNVAAAKQQNMLNNPNVVGPTGTQTTTYGAAGTPTEYQPTLTQTLSPEQQQLYNQSVKVKGLVGGLGEQAAVGLQGTVGTPVDFSGAPDGPGSGEATRAKVIDAMMGRADEDYEKQSDQSNSDLIAAGIPVGSKAYGDRQQMIERSRNDARNQAEISGGNAAVQEFGMDSQRRQQAIAEYMTQRQTPFNEAGALISGSQVPNQFVTPGYAQNNSLAPAPTYAAASALGDFNTDIYNQEVATANAIKAGVFKLGASAIEAGGNVAGGMAGKSDRRLKSNIVRLGTHPRLDIGIYAYDLDGRREVGVMADEVEQVMPQAVTTHPSGYKMVYYGMLTC